ncbi:hypothetical protein YPPY48_4758, partial [Yersinia pestis PY-48]
MLPSLLAIHYGEQN